MPNRSRYRSVSRRSVLKGVAGAAALGAMPGLGCSSADDAVLANVVAGRVPAAEPTTPPLDASETAAPTPDAPATSTPEQPTVVVAEPTATPLPVQGLVAGTELAIDFSYVQASGGKNVPPYIAVWVENARGELYDTIELWFQQDSKGPRWLPDLKRWFNSDQDRIAGGGADTIDVISGATRIAGSYSVAWDGIVDGVAAPVGDYFICIEAARERGPYSLVREPLPLFGASLELALADSGELVNAVVRTV